MVRHAIVIGGSIAGLLAGRALANHFERVTIIERDTFPDTPQPRHGTPQSYHLHVLLMRGQLVLEQFFPGLQNEFVASGAVLLDPAKDVELNSAVGWLPRYASNLTQISLSRPLLEWTIRKRLSAFANVQFLPSTVVKELVPSDDGTAIAGVIVRTGDRTQTLKADWIVDASGGTSKTPQWLEALGYTPPEEVVVNAFVGYASRIYQRPENAPTEWQGLFISCAPPHRTRGGVIFPIENDQWMVGLAGADHDYPPNDEAGFLEFVQSLDSSEFYPAIKEAKPLTPIYSFKGTENRLRYYDRMPRHPENFIVVGHAACAFNPIYGQGMTVAALTAQLLDQNFEKRSGTLKGFARQLQRKIGKLQAQPWNFAISQDYRYPGAEGYKPAAMGKWFDRYFDYLGQLMTEKTEIYQAFLEVIHMLKPSSTLLHPKIAVQVLQRALRS